MSAENFIPWEQIEPLVKPGMTGEQIRVAVVSALGLDPQEYGLVGMRWGPTLRDVLCGGVEVWSRRQFAETASRHYNSEVLGP